MMFIINKAHRIFDVFKKSSYFRTQTHTYINFIYLITDTHFVIFLGAIIHEKDKTAYSY